MLDWLGKLLGEKSSKLADGVSKEWIQAAARFFKPLDSRLKATRPGLADDVIAFVVTGRPVGVLGEVKQIPEVGKHLGVTGYGGRATGVPNPYLHFSSLPLDVALRWARLVEAAAQGRRQGLTLPPSASWAEALLVSTQGSGNVYTPRREKPKGLHATHLEAMLVESGAPADTLLAAAFAAIAGSNSSGHPCARIVADVDGHADALERHLESIRPHLRPATVPQRLLVLEMLGGAHATTIDELAPEIAELACSGSKEVRLAARGKLSLAGDAALDALQGIARSGSPDQRAHALRLLVALAKERKRDELVATARELASADKAASVRALLTEWGAEDATPATDAPQIDVVAPVIDWSSSPKNAIPDEALDEFFRRVSESIAQDNARNAAWSQAHGKGLPAARPGLRSDDRSVIGRYLASDRIQPSRPADARIAWTHVGPAMLHLIESVELTPVALFRLLHSFGCVHDEHQRFHVPEAKAFEALHRRTGRPTLLELDQMFADAGLPADAVLRTHCGTWTSLGVDWPDEDVWPLFFRRVNVVMDLLASGTDYYLDRNVLYRGLARLPALHPALVNALMSTALGLQKTERALARQALARHPGKLSRIVAALSDGKADTRTVAAKWLAELKEPDAIEPLEQALKKEKNDVAKGAMLDALEALGRPVEASLDRKSWLAEAKKTFAKGAPKELEWFPFNAVPQVRWASDGSTIDPDALKGMLVQAVKQKSPEPNAVLRKFCAMFEPKDREALGQFVLEAWLSQDVLPISQEEAEKKARDQARMLHGFMKAHPQHYTNTPVAGYTEDQLAAHYLPGMLKLPAGSAIGSKGLLAVAAACCAERAAPPVQRFLKEYYGTRAAQGKALIAMLAWIEHPSATQLMLSVGSRFRTKSFQEEATKQAEALAERKGWTLAELADRTIPSAGFDEDGLLELSYGERVFTARLLPNFKIELTNPDGKAIASLPEPRQDEDAELAKAAKKSLSAAKKELKSAVDLQSDRLYEALCTERDWSFSDWEAYLRRQPIMRHLVQRLIWARVEDGKVAATFRPLDDGTLTDVEDQPITLPPDARVRLAHDSLLDEATVGAWLQHLRDYEIEPLFQQMGKGTYALPADKSALDEIKDFEGHVLQAFSLRGRAGKLGYVRGSTQDGGWFYTYEKRFPTLGLQAIIEFTGNPLPEENRTVALTSLNFTKTGGSEYQRGKLRLSSVPKVLLSECWNDMRLMASDGTGYDADWQKKSEYR